jgi:hypothetical protein
MSQGKTPAPKPTQAEYERRVEEVMELILQGYGRWHIVRYASKTWDIGSRAVDDLLAKAKLVLRETNLEKREDLIAQISNNYWKLFRMAIKKGDINSAISAVREVAKINGLNEININHFMEDKRVLGEKSDKELDSILEDYSVNN